MPSSRGTDVSWPTTFNNIKVHLRREVLAARNVPLFRAAQSRQPALTWCGGIVRVLGVLSSESSRGATTREAVVRALVEEFQRERDPFWSAVLLLGFMPMLGAIRMRLTDLLIPDEELTSIVTATFLEVVSEIDVGPGRHLTALRLCQMTRKRVFRIINKERSLRDLERGFAPAAGDLHDEVDWSWPASPRGSVGDDPVVTNLSVALLHERGGCLLSAGQMDLVAETVVRGMRLWNYLDRIHPNLSPEARVREYQRLKRLRTRALKRLRRMFAEKDVPKTGGCVS